MPALAEPVLGDDGLYQLDWYLQSFLDLKEDLDGATAKGKRFAILWGLKGCPFCKKMHEVHMSDPVIEGYIRDNFEIVHLNHIGAREVTDFDGRRAQRKGVRASLWHPLHTDGAVLSGEQRAASARASRRTAKWRGCPACWSRRSFWRCSNTCARRAISRCRSPTG